MEHMKNAIIKFQSQNLIHTNGLLAVPKKSSTIQSKMIPIQDKFFLV